MSLSVGSTVAGFRVKSLRPVPEYKSSGILLEHEATGCEAYHLANDDTENVFSFIFKTPPRDSRGTAHIIEHSVLSGSRRFPIKDPFVALMKGSMNTFLNALTYPDKTVYPASSTVEQDYFNLMEVYADAVFFPLLRREIFHQEGRRIVLDEDQNPTVDGVVYNEMKGNYSDHENIVGEWSYRSLFPESVYRFDSGGEPDRIRELTYEDFLEFHRTWYHPSNCRIFLYGDVPTEKSLAFIEERVLSGFSRQIVDSSIESQPRWTVPISLGRLSPLAEGETQAPKSTITVNWLTISIDRPYNVLALEVLDEILLGNAGSPMQKVIVESGLGEDLSPVSGIDTNTMEVVFSFGIRGADESASDKFEKLVLDELRRLSQEGLPREVVEGSLRRVEFRNREIKGGVPFGLRLMGKSLRGWLHGSAPESTLEFEPWMEKLKADAAKPGYFERLIAETFIDNPHRTTVVITPSKEHTESARERLEEWTSETRATLTEDVVASIRTDADALKVFQDSPDKPEDLAKIPCLSLSDAPRKVETIDTKVSEIDGVTCHTLDQFTNGIVYADFAFDIVDVGEKALSYLPLLSRGICSSGLPGMGYDEVARELALKTGGFVSFLQTSSVASESGSSKATMVFRLKALESDLSAALDLAFRLILEADFADTKRVKDLLLELRNDFRAQVLPSGHSFVALRSGRRQAPVLEREERWRGISQLQHLVTISEDVENGIESVAKELIDLREALFTRSRLTMNLSADGPALADAMRQAHDFVAKLPAGTPPGPELIVTAPGDGGETHEALYVPATVGYVATSLPASPFENEEHSHEVLLASLMQTDFLWEAVRMRGGAYGVFAATNGGESLFTFASYRDPRILETLKAYRDSLDHFAERPVAQDVLEKTIISVVGKDVRPMSPSERSIVGFRRQAYGITDRLRQLKRDHILSTKPEDLVRAAQRLKAAMADSSFSVVMGGKDAIADAAKTEPQISASGVQVPV